MVLKKKINYLHESIVSLTGNFSTLLDGKYDILLKVVDGVGNVLNKQLKQVIVDRIPISPNLDSVNNIKVSDLNSTYGFSCQMD